MVLTVAMIHPGIALLGLSLQIFAIIHEYFNVNVLILPVEYRDNILH